MTATDVQHCRAGKSVKRFLPLSCLLCSPVSAEVTTEIILQRCMSECMVISGDSKCRLFLEVCGEEEGGGYSLHWGRFRELSLGMGRSRASCKQ